MSRVFVMTLALVLSGSAPPQVSHVNNDANATVGTVMLAASPTEVYRALTDYPQWSELFDGVKSATVVYGGRDDARVRMRSERFRSAYTIQFQNRPDQQVRFDVVDAFMGSKIGGELDLSPAADGGTILRAHLRTEMPSVIRWILPDRVVREKRAGLLKSHLEDLQEFFAR